MGAKTLRERAGKHLHDAGDFRRAAGRRTRAQLGFAHRRLSEVAVFPRIGFRPDDLLPTSRPRRGGSKPTFSQAYMSTSSIRMEVEQLRHQIFHWLPLCYQPLDPGELECDHTPLASPCQLVRLQSHFSLI